MSIRFGRPVIRFLTDLLYLPQGESPMELDGRVSGVADIIQQGWARRRMRFTTSSFPATVIGVSTTVTNFLDDPAFVSTDYPEKAIVRSDINRVALVQWQPRIAGPTALTGWTNSEAFTVHLAAFLFRGDSFNGLTVPADAVAVRWWRVAAAGIFSGWYPFGSQAIASGTNLMADGGQADPIFIPAGWGLAVIASSSGINWTAAHDFGMLRALVLDVPAEVKPY